MINEQVIADNLALIEHNRELECELARCKAKLGEIARLADNFEGRALAISESTGDLASGTDLGRMHAYFQVGRELMEAMR